MPQQRFRRWVSMPRRRGARRRRGCAEGFLWQGRAAGPGRQCGGLPAALSRSSASETSGASFAALGCQAGACTISLNTEWAAGLEDDDGVPDSTCGPSAATILSSDCSPCRDASRSRPAAEQFLARQVDARAGGSSTARRRALWGEMVVEGVLKRITGSPAPCAASAGGSRRRVERVDAHEKVRSNRGGGCGAIPQVFWKN